MNYEEERKRNGRRERVWARKSLFMAKGARDPVTGRHRPMLAFLSFAYLGFILIDYIRKFTS